MKFLIVTDAPTLKVKGKYAAYAPYVNEMDIWMKYCNATILSPTKYDKELLLKPFKVSPKVKSLPSVVFASIPKTILSILSLPYVFLKIFVEMFKADHIHLRCPGNIGLLGSIIQMFFPFKTKTVKYAGNWDPNSKQPLSYRIQKRILSNTFFTKNCKVLVYGEWKNQSKNIVPFFTASYFKSEIKEIENKPLSKTIKFIYVGAFSKGKQPILSVETIKNLHLKGYPVQLDMFGQGEEFDTVEKYVKENTLENVVFLHGNKPKEAVKEAFLQSHFLIFISKSEGWPKVVAEAMFWKCLPISSKVSCVSYMLDNGDRGILVDETITDKGLTKMIENCLKNEKTYQEKVTNAQQWSHHFTLDKFELEIKKLLV